MPFIKKIAKILYLNLENQLPFREKENKQKISQINTLTTNEPNKFDSDIMIQGLINLFSKDLLLKIKAETINEYETESFKQKLIASSEAAKHHPLHTKLLENSKKLLLNLALVEDALAAIELNTEKVKSHIKEKLNFNPIEKVSVQEVKKLTNDNK